MPREGAAGDAEYSSAYDAHEIGPGGETGQHEHHRNQFRRDQETDRLERHRFHGINFFVDLHRADFSGERRTRTADYHDRRHQGAKLARDCDGDCRGYELESTEFAKLIGALNRKNQSYEETNELNDG